MLREEPHNSQGKISLSPQVVLSVDEIRKAVENCNCFSNVSYLDTFILSKERKELLENLKDYDVVEIGAGMNPLNLHVPCKSYIGVDPFTGGGENGIIKMDGLSYLRTLKDKSVVIVCFGVIDEDILSKLSSEWKLQRKYSEELFQEITRVSSPFSILFGSDVVKKFGPPDIDCETGFGMVTGGVYNFN